MKTFLEVGLGALSVAMFLVAGLLFIYRMFRWKKQQGCWLCEAAGNRGGTPLGAVPQGENLKLFCKIGAIAIGSRLLILLLGWAVFGDHGMGFLPSLETLWTKSDAHHYLDIASQWYVNYGESRLYIVFFPLYPALVMGINAILGNLFISSLVVSNLAFAGACFYLYKFVGLDLDRRSCRRAVKYLLLFPVSFFFAGTYTESLFVLLLIASMYYARQGKILLASALGFGCALTRSLGVLVALPILMELFKNTDFAHTVTENGWGAAIKGLFPRVFSLALVPLGSCVYLLINKLVTGNWTQFLIHQKEHWYQSFGFFGDSVQTLTYGAEQGGAQAVYLWIPQLVVIFAVLALMIYGARKERASSQTFTMAYFYCAIAPTWLLSAPRYLMATPTIYVSMARLGERRWVDVALTAILSLGLVFMLQGFLRGMCIY